MSSHPSTAWSSLALKQNFTFLLDGVRAIVNLVGIGCQIIEQLFEQTTNQASWGASCSHRRQAKCGFGTSRTRARNARSSSRSRDSSASPLANNERSAGRTEVNEMTSRGFINSLFGRSGSFANRRRQRTGSFSSRPSSAMGFVDQPDAPVLLLLWL